MSNRQKLGGLYRVAHNFALDLRTRRHILMAVLRPSLENICMAVRCGTLISVRLKL